MLGDTKTGHRGDQKPIPSKPKITTMATKQRKRTLYECSHAKVLGEKIYCDREHPFPGKGDVVNILRLKRGEPLAFKVCQDCPDFDEMGPQVNPRERGWKGDK